jgi:hypothetical protein
MNAHLITPFPLWSGVMSDEFFSPSATAAHLYGVARTLSWLHFSLTALPDDFSADRLRR